MSEHVSITGGEIINNKSPEDKQVNHVSFRINDLQFEKLSLSASTYGLSIGQYAKQMALKSKLKTPYFNDDDAKKLLIELTRQGTNLNQIARRLNQNPLANTDDLKEAKAVLKEAREAYRNLWLQLRK
ncbi:plasmid mobilization protein [Alloprevotella tannerae]|uniref:plasmid mobilization protein n=1 Tax=Alloprevotella tannerae TaxID=76122 RepID=UPI003990C4BA